jgi:hypothetical protein
MTSSIPTVKAALVSVLAAALPSTQVIYGPVTAVTTTGSRVLTVGRAVGRREQDALGTTTASEQYTVELTNSVDIAGTSQQAADEQALADYVAARAAVDADSTLGITSLATVQVLATGADFELLELADDDGRHAAVRWSVSVYAQTT